MNRHSELGKWVGVGKHYALSLPEKKGRERARRTKTLKEYKAQNVECKKVNFETEPRIVGEGL
jgi:hypothetical protein